MYVVYRRRKTRDDPSHSKKSLLCFKVLQQYVTYHLEKLVSCMEYNLSLQQCAKTTNPSLQQALYILQLFFILSIKYHC